MKHISLIIAGLAISLYIGCSKSNPTTAATPTVVIPNAGTTWTLANTLIDSTGAVKKSDTTVRTVVQTNMQYQGFSDVVMTVEPNPSNLAKSDTVYLRYLADGDISRLSSPSIDPQLFEWLTVPYTTQLAQKFNFGGNINYLGYTHDTVTFLATNNGTGSVTVGGITYATTSITSSTWQTATATGKDSTNYTVQTNTFIPSKGIFGGRTVSMNVVNGKQVQRVQQTLIGVNIK
jgi:hypothetical protein